MASATSVDTSWISSTLRSAPCHQESNTSDIHPRHFVSAVPLICGLWASSGRSRTSASVSCRSMLPTPHQTACFRYTKQSRHLCRHCAAGPRMYACKPPSGQHALRNNFVRLCNIVTGANASTSARAWKSFA